jgi:vanillate O-demethylase ferredoxin subunit
MLTLQVIRREVQGDVVLLTLAHSEGIALPAFRAGAHIDLHLSAELVRPYSFAAIRRTGSTINWAS